MDMLKYQVVSVNIVCKAQCQSKGKGEGKIKEGRITSKTGQSWISEMAKIIADVSSCAPTTLVVP